MDEIDTDLPTVAPAPIAVGRPQGVAAWFDANTRVVTAAVGAAALIAVGAAGWRYLERSKADRADRALGQAIAQSAQPGPAGQTALRQVASGYAGTPAGTTAAMLLASSLYDAGQYEQGIRLLRRADPPAAMHDGILTLTAAGETALGQGRDAARIYLGAAKDAADPQRTARLMSDAARAQLAAGDTAAALATWKSVAARGGDAAAEARVRLGSLEASAGIRTR